MRVYMPVLFLLSKLSSGIEIASLKQKFSFHMQMAKQETVVHRVDIRL